jgi:hypothetical protein
MRRRVGFLFIICAAIPVAVFASTAWACGALTTASLSEATPRPGATVNVTLRNFSPSVANGGTFTPVQIRFGSRTGALVKSVEVPASREVTTDVRVPSSVGWHVLIATQYSTATGVEKSGAPARAVLRAQGTPVSGASAAPWGGGATPGGPASPDLPLPGILLSVAMLATGLTLVFRDKGKKAASRAALSA